MTNTQNKNSIRSILIILLYFIFPYIINFLSNSKLLITFSYLLLAAIIIFAYKNTFIKDFKEIRKNKKKYALSILKNVAIIFVVVVATNALIGILFNIKETSENDYSLLAMFRKSPIILILLTGIYYPIVEGVIFRKAIRDIINNKWLFIIFSSIFYFFFNVVYTSMSFTSMMTSLCYLFSMMVLSNYYWKTDNFTASIIVMTIYNLIISVLSFIL